MTAAMSCFVALAPAARGAEFTFKGQKIEYENAEYKEITDTTTGEILSVHIHRPKVAPKGSL